MATIMRVEDLKDPGRINILKYSLRDSPHATIEPNRTCNIRCRCYYNLDRNEVKPLGLVKEEIDAAAAKRNLQIITLLGGEPTLHPDLERIIAEIKSRGMMCHILTNGLRLLNDRDGRYLDGLIRAGVDKIFAHIDAGQSHVYGDIEAARGALFAKLEARRVPFALSITIGDGDQRTLPALIRHYSRYRYFDGVLAVLARDPLPPRSQDAQLLDEYLSLADELGIEPTNYIPSNVSDREISWLIYSYFVNPATGRAFSLSPLLDQIYRAGYKIVTGRQAFVIPAKPLLYEMALAIICLADAVLHPRKWAAFRRFMLGASPLRAGRFHFIAIQTPPEFDERINRLRFCYNCPDATIRNGMLTPVCIADHINPLSHIPGRRAIKEDWYRPVYEEMGEIGRCQEGP
jgi:hypothetical protein